MAHVAMDGGFGVASFAAWSIDFWQSTLDSRDWCGKMQALEVASQLRVLCCRLRLNAEWQDNELFFDNLRNGVVE